MGSNPVMDGNKAAATESRKRPHAGSAVARAARASWDFSVRRSMPLITALGVLAVLLGAGVGWLLWQQGQQASASAARDSAAIAAKSGVTAALSYNYRSFNSDAAQGEAALTGTFREEYTRLMTKVVASAATQQKAATSADVVSTAVMSATPTTAEVLLFVDQTTTGSSFTGPKLSGSRVVATMDKVGGKWLISAIKPV